LIDGERDCCEEEGGREKRRAVDGRKVMKDTTLHTKVPVCVCVLAARSSRDIIKSRGPTEHERLDFSALALVYPSQCASIAQHLYRV
jgi:hypothetical protein